MNLIGQKIYQKTLWRKQYPILYVLVCIKMTFKLALHFATFAYLCDVFIVTEHRGKGLSKWLMEKIMQHPDLQNLRRWTLGTRDAHELYRKFGFREPDNNCNNMEIRIADIYSKMKHDQ